MLEISCNINDGCETRTLRAAQVAGHKAIAGNVHSTRGGIASSNPRDFSNNPPAATKFLYLIVVGNHHNNIMVDHIHAVDLTAAVCEKFAQHFEVKSCHNIRC